MDTQTSSNENNAYVNPTYDSSRVELKEEKGGHGWIWILIIILLLGIFGFVAWKQGWFNRSVTNNGGEVVDIIDISLIIFLFIFNFFSLYKHLMNYLYSLH